MGTDQSEGSGEGTCRLAPGMTEAAPVVTQEEKVGVGRQVHIQRWVCGTWGAPGVPGRSRGWRDWLRVISLSLVTESTQGKMRSARRSVRCEERAEPRGPVGQGE